MRRRSGERRRCRRGRGARVRRRRRCRRRTGRGARPLPGARPRVRRARRRGCPAGRRRPGCRRCRRSASAAGRGVDLRRVWRMGSPRPCARRPRGRRRRPASSARRAALVQQRGGYVDLRRRDGRGVAGLDAEQFAQQPGHRVEGSGVAARPGRPSRSSMSILPVVLTVGSGEVPSGRRRDAVGMRSARPHWRYTVTL